MPSAACLPHSILFFLPVDTHCPNSVTLTTIWYFAMWLYHDLFIYPLSKAFRISHKCKQFSAALFEQMFESFSKLYSQEWHYFAGLLSQGDKQFPASLSLHCWFGIIFFKCKSNLVTPLLKYLSFLRRFKAPVLCPVFFASLSPHFPHQIMPRPSFLRIAPCFSTVWVCPVSHPFLHSLLFPGLPFLNPLPPSFLLGNT